MKQIAKIALFVVLLLGGVVQFVWCEDDAEQHSKELNAQAVAAYRQGKYKEGVSLAEQAHIYAVKHLGLENPDTMTSINNLATLYKSQGRYAEAEPLYKEAFQLREKVLGKEHPDTLASINNLATLYYSQGRYAEAEPLLKEVLQLCEKVLGREHPNTLIFISNLAELYDSQGRYAEAEPLLKEALQLREKVLEKEHPDTLISIGNLAALYKSQGRYAEAEPLLKEVLQLGEKVLGREHPDTMTSINNLAELYKSQGRYAEAEPLYKEAFQLRENVLGKEHPDTLASINNLAALYDSQGRYAEAEPLYKEALQLRENVLGKEHPDTLASINNLAALYDSQGRYAEADPLLKEALQLFEKVLGKEHPDTLKVQTNSIVLLINTDKPAVALRLLRDQEQRLLSRSFQELYTSSSEKVRRLYLQSISKFQHAVFSLAKQKPEKEYQQFASEVMLRWKQVYAEESSVQHKLLNLSNNPEAAELSKQLAAAQEEVSQALRQPKGKENIPELIEQANQDETALLALARRLRTGLEVKDVTLDKVLAALPQDSGLIEYRLFFPVDFKTGDLGKSHLAVLLLLADPNAKQRFIFRDLGPFAEIEKHLHDETAETYKQLLGPFDEQIRNLKQLYIAPDGPLSLLSFASLRLPDGRFLAERQQINRLQTGRDLIENGKDFPRGKGLVAIGGAKYGSMPADKKKSSSRLVEYQQRAARELAQGIKYLSESRKEARAIGKLFTTKVHEPAEVLIGDDASEYNLKHLKQPPRILHPLHFLLLRRHLLFLLLPQTPDT
ncbi:MAG: CHAT domain-containing protein, partial [Candidatus Electrothrix sp. AUS1_2]|nr:CHAT domain-containing protein [Candidatus Electrothrix sp. AUS1_2]